MLSATNRLKNRRDIERVFRRGQYLASGPLASKIYLSRRAESRAVVVVGKKVSKKATVRNRIRRRVAAELAGQWATVPTGYDIVLTVRESIAEAPAADIKQHLERVLKTTPK